MLSSKSILVGLFVCVDVLRPSQPNGVMSSAVTRLLGRLSPLSGYPVLVHILSPENDNCPSSRLELAEGKE